MNGERNALRRRPPRIRIEAEMLERLETLHPGVSVSDLAKSSGLPYALVYNILNKRVRSVSARHYRILLKEAPPRQDRTKVDGDYFRKMVMLWLYLNGTASKVDLYRELCNTDENKKPDYRVLNGHTDTIDSRLEDAMEQKFIGCGLDRPTILQWIDEHSQLNPGGRVAYRDIRPILHYLNRMIGIHPTALLNQLVDRFESGELKTVSRNIYERAAALKHRAEVAFGNQDRQEIDRIKEAVYGKREGYVRYSSVESELKFLQRYGRKSPKRYLGRGLHAYEKGACKRIASWRAAKIHDDCGALIVNRPDLPLRALPKSGQHMRVKHLQTVLLRRAAELLSREDGIVLEKKILSPSLPRGKYTEYDSGYTQFDRASSTLGMKKRAFDLMVAKHCDIFKIVGRYANRWYLSDLYLKELSENAYFNVVTTKYERMAETAHEAGPIDPCVL